MRRWFVRFSLALGVAAALRPGSARAWDPSTTHQGILEQAVLRSAIHLRWMNASELERGLFTALRVNPALLDERELRLVRNAQRNAHADSGARPLGGPGACPGADAPPETQLNCVDGDVWELTALGWLRLGIIAETTPTARHVHHFLDRTDPASPSWEDPELSRTTLRVRQSRSNGAPLAGVATLTNFSGDGPSAIAWLDDEGDALAPARLFAHLDRASAAESRDEREHHLALALLCAGALLHVVQDVSVPAHARGDVTAFFAPLSRSPADRGLPLQEYVRGQWGRGPLPGLEPVASPGTRPSGAPLTHSLRAHLLGDNAYEGLGRFTATRFLSESSLPRPRAFADETSAEKAAAEVLRDTGLDPVEIEGARLAPWPADAGYLVTATGRPLAAFDLDEFGRTRFFLDEAVYRDQAHALLPRAVEASRSVLDLVFAQFPTLHGVAGGSVMELEVPAGLDAPKLVVMLQDAHGRRRVHQQLALRPGEANRIVGLPSAGEDGSRVILVLRANGPGGHPIVTEHQLPVEPEPEAIPEPAPKNESQNEPDPDADPDADPNTEAEPDPDTEAEPDPRAPAPAKAPTPKAEPPAAAPGRAAPADED